MENNFLLRSEAGNKSAYVQFVSCDFWGGWAVIKTNYDTRTGMMQAYNTRSEAVSAAREWCGLEVHDSACDPQPV